MNQALLHLPGNGAASDPAPDAPDAPGPHGTRAIIIALCSEQGFVGGYNGTVLDRAAALLANEAAGRAQLLLVGTRGLVAASATYAHTSGTSTSTITKTFTANGSDSLPVTIAQVGLRSASGTGGTFHSRTLLSSTATLSASGDALTVTWTFTLTPS